MKSKMICLVCPRGCHLEVEQVDDKVMVQGNFCAKGIPYAHAELKHPARVLTTTVALEAGALPLVPLKSAAPLPKEQLMQAMAVLRELRLTAPVHCGDVALANILDTGIDMLITRSIPAEHGANG